MKKLESSLKNMALALTGFSVVAGAILGWVNKVTAEPIAQANAKTLSDAIAVERRYSSSSSRFRQ